ncbi:hypothetical protein ACFPOC_07725 [Rubellimicrobium aerolatum]|uniref:Helix-turn-helix transcriptional regulator n=2 Tax=Rubellimicrobium aerolatum TaxID=490979 RepID=A0ABW0SBS9_9RHOB
MLKNGQTKLALDRVAALARALEVDPRRLYLLALDQEGHATTAREIEEIFNAIVTRNEAEWLEALREASDHRGPAVCPGPHHEDGRRGLPRPRRPPADQERVGLGRVPARHRRRPGSATDAPCGPGAPPGADGRVDPPRRAHRPARARPDADLDRREHVAPVERSLMSCASSKGGPNRAIHAPGSPPCRSPDRALRAGVVEHLRRREGQRLRQYGQHD